MTIYVGHTQKVGLYFTDDDGAPADPDDFTLEIGIQSPYNAWTLVESKSKADCTRLSAGVYLYLFTPISGGRHQVFAVTTGLPSVVLYNEFTVKARP